jgi:hypothetical protein
MRPAFYDIHHADLGKRARFRPVSSTAEFLDIVRGVGDVEHVSIHGHESPRSSPCALCPLCGDRHSDPVEQCA